MVQSLNTKALLTLAHVLRNPRCLVPHVSVTNVSEVDYKSMKEEAGIQAVVFDKDNTLTAPYVNTIHDDAINGLKSAKEVFGRDNVAIMSNSAGTDDDTNYEDAKHIEDTLGVAVIIHSEKKPGGLKEVLSHFDIEDPAALCMVGDRLLTDIVFGNLYGMLTVHTLPLCKGKDNRGDNTIARIIRGMENKALYTNWIGSRILLKEEKLPKHKYWRGKAFSPLILSSDSEKVIE